MDKIMQDELGRSLYNSERVSLKLPNYTPTKVRLSFVGVPFLVDNDSVTLDITVEEWEVMRQVAAISMDLLDISDEDIAQKVTKEVDNLYSKNDETFGVIRSLCRFGYDYRTTSKELLIEEGIRRQIEARNRQKNIKSQVDAFWAKNKD